MSAYPQGHMLCSLSKGVLRPYYAPSWKRKSTSPAYLCFSEACHPALESGKEMTSGHGSNTAGMWPGPGTSNVTLRSPQTAGSSQGLSVEGATPRRTCTDPRAQAEHLRPRSSDWERTQDPWPTWGSTELESRRWHQHSPASWPEPWGRGTSPHRFPGWGLPWGAVSGVYGGDSGLQWSLSVVAQPARTLRRCQLPTDRLFRPDPKHKLMISGWGDGFLQADHKRRKPSWAGSKPQALCFSFFLLMPGCLGPGGEGVTSTSLQGLPSSQASEDRRTVYTGSRRGSPPTAPYEGDAGRT